MHVCGISDAVSDALSGHPGEPEQESAGVIHGAVADAESLFVKVAQQRKRFDAHVGSADRALQQRPDASHTVGVNSALHIGFGIVDDFVDEVGIQKLRREA